MRVCCCRHGGVECRVHYLLLLLPLLLLPLLLATTPQNSRPGAPHLCHAHAHPAHRLDGAVLRRQQSAVHAGFHQHLRPQ